MLPDYARDRAQDCVQKPYNEQINKKQQKEKGIIIYRKTKEKECTLRPCLCMIIMCITISCIITIVVMAIMLSLLLSSSLL